MEALGKIMDRVVAEHYLKGFTTSNGQDSDKYHTYYLQMIIQYFLYANESQLTYPRQVTTVVLSSVRESI